MTADTAAAEWAAAAKAEIDDETTQEDLLNPVISTIQRLPLNRSIQSIRRIYVAMKMGADTRLICDARFLPVRTPILKNWLGNGCVLAPASRYCLSPCR